MVALRQQLDLDRFGRGAVRRRARQLQLAAVWTVRGLIAFDEPAPDFDVDGDLDVVCSIHDEDYSPGTRCWENLTSDGLSWSETIVNDPDERTPTVYPSDIDDDGDLDVIGATDYDNGLRWWELLGSPPEPDPVIVTLAPGTSPVIWRAAG